MLLRHRARLLALAALLALLILAAPAAASVTWRSGALTGFGGAGLSQFASWRGAPATVATDYIGSDDWSQIENPAWAISQWTANRSVQPDLSVAMWPWSGGSLAEAASGAYNAHFRALAQNLVNAGLGSIALRLGWEFNDSWYRWGVTNSTQAAQYAAAWRQIVGAMKSVRGASFTYVWCPDLRNDGIDPALAYPGNAYVSVIGLDVYDWNVITPGASPAQRWSDLVNARFGLQWQARFAAGHGKQTGFPEWGLVNYTPNPAASGGDDPLYVENMFCWFGSHNVAFEVYSDVDEAGQNTYYGLTTGNGMFPQGAAVYQQLYSGSQPQATVARVMVAKTTTSQVSGTQAKTPTARVSGTHAHRASPRTASRKKVTRRRRAAHRKVATKHRRRPRPSVR